MPNSLRKLLMTLAMVITVVYLVFRVKFTLNLESPYSTFASYLLFFAEAFGGMQMLLYFFNVWDTTEPEEQEPMPDCKVDVMIPTYNEDVLLLRGTIQACLAMDYEHNTYVLDDGHRPEVKELAEELGASYITRDGNQHAKAGNLNNALEQTDGEFVIILDADHVPTRHMITRMLGYFRNPRVGFVQSPHAFYNFENFQASCNYDRQKYWEEGLLFYQMIQPGKNRWDSVVFAGSAAMFRRKALEDVGLIAVETITEDMHTGMRMASKGWKSVYITDRLIAGQAAPDVTTFHTQRLRWGEGNVSILFHDNPLTMRGLSLTQRISYFASIIHWFNGFNRLAVYLTPILLLFTGVAPFTEINAVVIAMLVAYLGITHVAMRLVSGKNASLLDIELFAMMTFWTSIRGCLRGVFKRKTSTFVVTSKRGGRQKGTSMAPFIVPQAAIILLGFASLLWTGFRLMFHTTYDFVGPAIAGPLVVYHMLLAWVVLKRSLTEENKRFSYRHKAVLPVEFEFDDPSLGSIAGLGLSYDLSEYGLGLITYRQLPENAEGKVFLTAGDRKFELRGIIRHSDAKIPEDLEYGEEAELGQTGTFRYGIEFLELTPEAADGLSSLAMDYTVPQLYHWFNTRRSKTRKIAHRLAHLMTWKKRHAKRMNYRVPVEVHLPGAIEGEPGTVLRTVTEDLSRQAVRVLLSEPLEDGVNYPFAMPSPVGLIEGTVSVLRRELKEFGALQLHSHVLNFEEFSGQGRGLLYDLLSPIEEHHIQMALKARSEQPKVPLFQPVAVGVLSAAILIPGGLTLFHTLNTDKLFLRNAASDGITVHADRQRVDELFEEAINGTPDLQRLTLLTEILLREGRREDADRLTRRMLAQEPDNLGLQLAQGNSLASVGRVDEADEIFLQILEVLDADPTDHLLSRSDVLVSAARNLVNVGRMEEGLVYFQELKQIGFTDAAVEEEYAGALLAVGDLEGAVEIYQNGQSDPEMHMRLASIHTAREDFVAAESECRVALSLNPEHNDALHLLAQVLTWQKRFADAKDVYAQLAVLNPQDSTLDLRQAELSLWSGDHASALLRYKELVDGNPSDMQLWFGYLDAASGIASLGPAQEAMVFQIDEEARSAGIEDSSLFARLGTAFANMGEGKRGIERLQQAVDLNPKNRALRLQLADLLHNEGEYRRADQHYQMLMGAVREDAFRPPTRR